MTNPTTPDAIFQKNVDDLEGVFRTTTSMTSMLWRADDRVRPSPRSRIEFASHQVVHDDRDRPDRRVVPGAVILVGQLIYEGFSQSQAEYGVNMVGL